jgi:uncharacterized protein (TIGR02246 family)
MRKLLWILALCLPLAAQNLKDDEAIKGLVQEYLAARDRDDAKAVGELFTEDADQLVSSGEWRRGREELVKGTLASTRNGGKRTLRVDHIRHINKDSAIADAHYELIGAADTRHMWSTFVVTRTPAGWKIAAIRNMLPAPPAK